MADTIVITSGANSTPPAGTIVATDQDSGSGAHYAINKLVFGPLDTFTHVTSSVGYPSNLVQVGGSAIAIGQAAMAASLPVVIASNQSAIPASQSGTWNVGTVTTVTTVSAVTTVSTVTTVSDAQVQGKAAHDAAVSGNPVLLGGYASASAPTDVSADGDAVRLWCDRAGRVQVGDGGSTLSIDDGGSSITVDGTISVSGAVDTELPAAAALADNTANPTVPGVGAFAMIWDGSTWDRWTGAVSGTVTIQDGGNVLSVDDAGGSLTVDGTVSVSGTVTVDSELPAAAALADNASNPTAPAVGAFLMVWDGSTWDRGPGTSADGLLVNLGANNDVTVTGTVTANAGSGTFVVGDGGGSLTVDNGGTFAVQESGAALTALQLIDDVIFTDDAAYTPGTSKALVIGAQADDTTPDSVNEGDAGALRMSARRELYVQLRDAAGNERGLNVDASGNIGVTDAGGSLTVDGTVAATQSGTWTVQPGNTANTTPWLTSIHDGTTKATVRELGTNDALNVAIVDGSGNQITSFGGGTQFAEDAAHTTGDVGTFALTVRKDTPANLSGTDGDYEGLQVSGGLLWTRVRGIQTPNGDSAMDETNDALRVNVVAGSGSGVSHVDDAAFTPATDDVVPIAGVLDDTTPDSVDEGDAGAVRMSANRNLYVRIRDNAGNERGLNVDANGNIGVTDSGTTLSIDDGAGSITVDGTVSVNTHSVDSITTSVTPGTGATNLGKAEDAVHATGDVGVMALAVRTDTAANRSGADGDYEPLQISAGRLWTSTTVTSLPASTNTIEVVGDVAEDAALAGNPVRTGVRASRAQPTSMSADGDIVTPWADREGRQVVRRQVGTATTTQVADSATSVSILAASTSRIGATVYNDSSATLYLNVESAGTAASTTNFSVKLFPDDYYEVPEGYTGSIQGIWSSDAGGNAYVTEYTV